MYDGAELECSSSNLIACYIKKIIRIYWNILQLNMLNICSFDKTNRNYNICIT